MEVDVSASFDYEGLTSCPQGYALTGMWRQECAELHCMEKINCCKVIEHMPTVSPTQPTKAPSTKPSENPTTYVTTTGVADWTTSFDNEGWSVVPDGGLISGFFRSDDMNS